MKTWADLETDGGSDVLGQVLRQRQRMAEATSAVDHVLAIGSGKGGVGKSTLTMQLAQALRRAGRRCAILDADLNGPCQARLAGLEGAPLLPGTRGMAMPRTRSGLGVVSLGSLVPESAHLAFDSVATGDSHVWRATREFHLFRQLLGLVEWGRLDVLLVDLPPGAERTVQYAEALGPAACFVLVTIPAALARGVVARSLAALEETPNRVLGYIENMSGYWCASCNEVRPLFGDGGAGDDGRAGGGRAPELGLPCLGQGTVRPEAGLGIGRRHAGPARGADTLRPGPGRQPVAERAGQA